MFTSLSSKYIVKAFDTIDSEMILYFLKECASRIIIKLFYLQNHKKQKNLVETWLVTVRFLFKIFL